MAKRRRSLRNLARLLPSGAAGLSMSLAYADASATALSEATAKAPGSVPGSVKDRLQAIRGDVSSAIEQYAADGKPFVAVDPNTRLAWWGNGGWRNGGWGNGGWRNGGWGNGGWHNWGNGWHNW
jgi:rSAM-associated Gly-rich repeat protein